MADRDRQDGDGNGEGDGEDRRALRRLHLLPRHLVVLMTRVVAGKHLVALPDDGLVDRVFPDMGRVERDGRRMRREVHGRVLHARQLLERGFVLRRAGGAVHPDDGEVSGFHMTLRSLS